MIAAINDSIRTAEQLLAIVSLKVIEMNKMRLRKRKRKKKKHKSYQN